MGAKKNSKFEVYPKCATHQSSTVGIDEHFFTRRKGRAEFVTLFTDYKSKRLREVAFGIIKAEVITQIAGIEGRENVRNAIIDMCDGYRSLIREHFPNAQIIADRFHVLRLLTPAINKNRVVAMGDDRKNPVRRLLLRNRPKLKYYERDALITSHFQSVVLRPRKCNAKPSVCFESSVDDLGNAVVMIAGKFCGTSIISQAKMF